MWNTLWVGVLVVVDHAGCSACRRRTRWPGWTGRGRAGSASPIFLVYLVPPSLLFLSLSRIVVALGLQDSTWSLVLVYPTITIPVSVWLLIGFLKADPETSRSRRWSTGTAASARSGGRWCRWPFPGIVAVVVFAFTLTASEFIYALAFVSPSRREGDQHRRARPS